MKVETAQKYQRKVLSQPTQVGYDYTNTGDGTQAKPPTSLRRTL